MTTFFCLKLFFVFRINNQDRKIDIVGNERKRERTKWVYFWL